MDIVDKLITRGWFLEAVDPNHRIKTNHYYIYPPDGYTWETDRINIQYGSLVILVPKYEYDNPRDKPPPGMPLRFGRRRVW
jgi:hypothetical protein